MSRIVAVREQAEEGVPGRLRRQPDVPRVHRAAHGRDAARLPVRERRAARRLDRHAQLRQPRHRGRAGRRQGPDRPGAQQRREPEPARPREGHRGHREARRASKKLVPDDVQGGTFTITNPGGYGTFHGTPVISQPQSAILGTYALVKRPWVVAGRARPGRDRDPADDEHHAHVRPPARRRRATPAASCATCASGSRPGRATAARPLRPALRQADAESAAARAPR